MTRALLLALALAVAGMALAAEPALIPRPADVVAHDGTCTLHAGAFAAVPAAARPLYLDTLSAAAGFAVRPAPAAAPCAIQFLGPDGVGKEHPTPAGEGYLLRVTPQAVLVHAATPAGHWNGLQTLAQLLEGAAKADGAATVPCLTIADAPRFGWRGFMLDESRHFSGKPAVLRLLDIFWWRHDKPEVLRRALDDGFPVVLCPRRPCYFDFVQHDSHRHGRRWGGFNPLADVHAFPDSLAVLKPADSALVRGIQACLWTETAASQQRRDFLTFPRLLALAEAAWTPAGRKDFGSFEQRLAPHLGRLRARGLHPFDPFADTPEVQAATPPAPGACAKNQVR